MDFIKPVDASGNTIDASFRVDERETRFGLYFASRGGTKGTPNARNTEYHIGLTLLLERMKLLDSTIVDILLDSRDARKLPHTERRLVLPATVEIPIRLASVDDVDGLRRMISKSQRHIVSAVNPSGRNITHGNRMRSINLLFHVGDDVLGVSAADVAQFLTTGNDAVLPTVDRSDLQLRAARLMQEERSTTPRVRPSGNPTPRRSTTKSSSRYLRLPAVVAYVLGRSQGHCELCGNIPFFTDQGKPYLEVHHVHQLADGGPDIPENAVALCPNCHRELHHGADRSAKLQILAHRVPELEIKPR